MFLSAGSSAGSSREPEEEVYMYPPRMPRFLLAHLGFYKLISPGLGTFPTRIGADVVSDGAELA